MSDPTPPPPERCLHNLHRAADRAADAPEPTDLCRNGLGVFHMLDCPLVLGRRCAWFTETTDPHPAATDAEIAAARDEMRRDFLSWRYRQRVRNLAKPRELLAHRIVVDGGPAVPEVEAPLLLRAPPPSPDAPVAEATAEPQPVVVPEELPAAPVPVASVEPAPVVPSVESYPGQRRSEDRSARKKRRPAPSPLAAPAGQPVPDDDDAEDEPGDAADDGAEQVAERAPEPPRTIDQLLEVLPEARLPDRPPSGPRRAFDGERGPRPRGGRDRRGGGPPRDGRRPPPPGAPPQQGPRDAAPGGPPREPGPGPLPPGAPRGPRRRRRGRRGGGPPRDGAGPPPGPAPGP